MCFKCALEQLTNAKIYFNMPMKNRTSFGVGGCAKYYAEIDSLYSLNQLISLAKEYKIKYKVIGNGTNLLVSDLGFDGIIIDLKKLNEIFFKQKDVRVMAGAKLENLIRFTVENSLTGLEVLSGIPATVGGAIVMNAGAFGHNISDYLLTVETLKDGKLKVYDKNDCNFSYRNSRFLNRNEIIVSATFSFLEGEKEIIKSRVKTYLDLRHSIQPKGRSCGSVFKNPKPFTAGSLIDKAGLKGYSVGGATVSNEHANFIITSSKAKAKDVYLLIQKIKSTVKEVFNIDIKEEVETIGEF